MDDGAQDARQGEPGRDPWDDQDRVVAWCADERAKVEAYLEAEGLAHGGLSELPAWEVPPYLAVWGLESLERPGWLGWWVLSGDLPTDVLPADEAGGPREVLAALGARWAGWVEAARAGGDGGEHELGEGDLERLEERARVLLQLAHDDGAWVDEDGPAEA